MELMTRAWAEPTSIPHQAARPNQLKQSFIPSIPPIPVFKIHRDEKDKRDGIRLHLICQPLFKGGVRV